MPKKKTKRADFCENPQCKGEGLPHYVAHSPDTIILRCQTCGWADTEDLGKFLKSAVEVLNDIWRKTKK